MNKYLQYVLEFQENNQKGIDFVNNQLKKHLVENTENQTEIETILDYLYSNQSVDVSKIGYKTILGKTEKRHKKLQSVSTKNDETEGVDYEIFLDYGDGFKFVILKSKESYEREGKLMSHCVSSYYGRDTVIYSLRDESNKPHCTIEDGRQIKGKGNGKIDPKYIDYIVQFLNKKGMSVGENEMKNLGYFKLDTIDEGLTCEKSYNGYVYEGNLSLIKDKKGNTYNGFGLWNIKNVVDIKEDGKFYLYEDVKNIVDYSNLVIDELKKDVSYSAQLASSGYSAQLASSGYSAQLASSGEYAKLASSGNSAKLASSGEYAKLASSGNSAKLASSGYSAQLASSGEYAKLASSGYSAQLASSGYSAQLASSGNSAKLASSGYSAQLASSGYSAQLASSGNSAQLASSGNSAQLASSGEYAKLEAQGEKSVIAGIGINNIAKGIIGTRIVLAEYVKDGKEYFCKNVKSAKIDGKKLKADVRYKLEGGKFVEIK